MKKKILQMERVANKRGVTHLSKFARCKATVTVNRETRYRTVTQWGNISVAANANRMQIIRIDVDEYKKHYPEVNMVNMMKSMYKGCKLMEVEG